MSTEESISLLSAIIQQNPQIVGLLSNLSSAIPAMNSQDSLPQSVPPVYRTAVQKPINQIPVDQYAAKSKFKLLIKFDSKDFSL